MCIRDRSTAPPLPPLPQTLQELNGMTGLQWAGIIQAPSGPAAQWLQAAAALGHADAQTEMCIRDRPIKKGN